MPVTKQNSPRPVAIRHIPRRRMLLFPLAVALGFAACEPRSGEDDDGTRTIVQPIEAVEEGRVEPVIRFYDRGWEGEVLRSHAVGAFTGSGGCTATWVGPHTAMTAAHCGGSADGKRPNGSSVTIRMEWYPAADTLGDAALDQAKSMRRDYTCSRKLASAFRASSADLAVWECGVGEDPAPGDLFGWVDYSVLENDTVGDSVYSVWFNPVDTNPEWRGVRLFSAGHITKTDLTSWAAPNCVTNQPSRLPFVHQTDLYSQSGASGSLQLSPVTHTAVIGPQSTGSTNTRNASSMAQILNQGFLPPGEEYRVETNYDPSLPAATTDRRTGCGHADELQNPVATDSNGNLVLDVHERIDNAISERPILHLGFDSRWRRILWQPGPAFVSFERGARSGTFDVVLHGTSAPDPSGYVPALRHQRMSLKPDTRYDIRVRTQAARSTAVKVRVQHQGQDQCPTWESATVVPGANQSVWSTFSVMTGSCSGYMLDLLLEPNKIILVSDIVVAERDAVWTFETWDSREPWTGPGDGHALIYENGDPNTGIFAAQITGGADQDNIQHRTLALEALPVLPNQRYKLIFRARDTWGTGPTGVVEIGPSGATVLLETFTPETPWQSHEFEFDSGADDGTGLQFSVMGSGRISVDDVQLVYCEDGVCP